MLHLQLHTERQPQELIARGGTGMLEGSTWEG